MIKECVNKTQNAVKNNGENLLLKRFLRRIMAVVLIGIIDTEWTRWHISAPTGVNAYTPPSSTKPLSSE